MACNGNGPWPTGLFEFDATSLELRREGALGRLQSQPAEVLALLIKRADEIVSRDDLRAAVGGDKTFVDFEAGLNFCISQLRSALQDDSARPVKRIFTLGLARFLRSASGLSSLGSA